MMRELDQKVPMEELDPGRRDPGFWLRFHGRVLADAREELARRRMAGDLSVVDVVFSWRRALVPMALLAATLAGIFLMSHEEPVAPLGPIALEEARSRTRDSFHPEGSLIRWNSSSSISRLRAILTSLDQSLSF